MEDNIINRNEIEEATDILYAQLAEQKKITEKVNDLGVAAIKLDKALDDYEITCKMTKSTLRKIIGRL